LRGKAWDGRGGGREGHANGVLDLVVPDPVMTRTDVRAACTTAKEVGEVGQLKRCERLNIRMPGTKMRHIGGLLLVRGVTRVAGEWMGRLGRLARGQGGRGCVGLGSGTGR
jgi:hypothetical protein